MSEGNVAIWAASQPTQNGLTFKKSSDGFEIRFANHI